MTERNDGATDAFLRHKARIDSALVELVSKSDDHFDVHPDALDWGDVGDLADVAAALTELTDRLYRRGEFA